VLERARKVVGLEIVVTHLGGEEEFLAFEPGSAHRLPDLLLVAVIGRGVEVAIAGADRRQDRLRARVLLQSHGAKTDDRDTRAMRFDELHEVLRGYLDVISPWRIAATARSSPTANFDLLKLVRVTSHRSTQ